ncbi:hypothetical protein JCM14469_39490 [Desulfatiferula olefinivorans]
MSTSSTHTPDKETWVWAIVQNPGSNESILGQQEQASGVRFVPAFYSKDACLMSINMLRKDEAQTYESQAIMYEDLSAYASRNDFMIFFLDEKGKILDKIAPVK